MKYFFLQRIFQLALFMTLLLSVYIFIQTMIFNHNNKNKRLFNTWQFPMLLALFLDTLYIY